MKTNIKTLIFFIGIYSSLAQGQHTENKITVKDLSFMIGTWKGEGWILGRDRKVKRFSQTEKIIPKADNEALMVEGIGYALDEEGKITDREIHNAFGIISYNKDKENITMLAFTKISGRMESNIDIIGDLKNKKLQWSYVNTQNGLKVRFTDDLSKKDTWKEIGEAWVNNKWAKFFEMTLYRIE